MRVGPHARYPVSLEESLAMIEQVSGCNAENQSTCRPAQLYELEGATASLEGAVAYFGKPQEIHFLEVTANRGTSLRCPSFCGLRRKV